MSFKTILVIISVGFIIQGTFFAVFYRGKPIYDREKVKDNPKEALKVQGKLLLYNLLYWGVVIFLVRFFLH
jgi:hypothetical protein